MNTRQMNHLTLSKGSIGHQLLVRWRYFLPVLFSVLLVAPPTRHIVFGVISDAFFQVGVFVLATLCLYHLFANIVKNTKIIQTENKPVIQVFFAALLGALPGCGGAIIVMTQFIQGKFSFGAVVAVLTATMGDAAFLLLATIPQDAFLMIIIGFVSGSCTGIVIDLLCGKDYLRNKPTVKIQQPRHQADTVTKAATGIWKVILLPALCISILFAFQKDPNEWLNLPENTVESFGGFIAIAAIAMWAREKTTTDNRYQEFVAEENKAQNNDWFIRAVQDTHFVLTWAVLAFVLFELFNVWSGVELLNWFHSFAGVAPLMGILVGLLPGCGPQIIVTSLYVQGAVPFSAQLGNAISNDGDALFPAIALAPKVAIYATLFSTVPAFIIAYGYFFLFEM